MNDLTERLRKYGSRSIDGDLRGPALEAATTLDTLTQENARLRQALEPFAQIAHGEVWEKFISDSRMTLRISNGGGDRHLTFVNAECFQEARKALGGGDE